MIPSFLSISKFQYSSVSLLIQLSSTWFQCDKGAAHPSYTVSSVSNINKSHLYNIYSSLWHYNSSLSFISHPHIETSNLWMALEITLMNLGRSWTLVIVLNTFLTSLWLLCCWLQHMNRHLLILIAFFAWHKSSHYHPTGCQKKPHVSMHHWISTYYCLLAPTWSHPSAVPEQEDMDLSWKVNLAQKPPC